MSARKAAGKGAMAAAACMGCCAPPIIGALGVTAGMAAAAGVFVGLTALFAVLLGGATWITTRRLRHGRPGATSEVVAVTVGGPVRRADPSS